MLYANILTDQIFSLMAPLQNFDRDLAKFLAGEIAETSALTKISLAKHSPRSHQDLKTLSRFSPKSCQTCCACTGCFNLFGLTTSSPQSKCQEKVYLHQLLKFCTLLIIVPCTQTSLVRSLQHCRSTNFKQIPGFWRNFTWNDILTKLTHIFEHFLNTSLT